MTTIVLLKVIIVIKKHSLKLAKQTLNSSIFKQRINSISLSTTYVSKVSIILNFSYKIMLLSSIYIRSNEIIISFK